MTGLGFEPILINKIRAFQLITLLNLKYHKNVRTILELKMCLILKQKRAFMLVFIVMLPGSDSNRRPIGYTYPLIS